MATRTNTIKRKNIQKKGKGNLAYYISLLFVVILTTITYFPSLKNNFVNWDDIIYIMNNDMITAVSMKNIVKMFSSFWMGNYHPVTILSFAFDYHFVRMTPYGYHLHNFLLHIINSVLVAVFCYRLLNKNVLVSFIVAALFAVHPLHVESVAWVSERKDLLYTLWFLLSLIIYLYWLQKKTAGYLVLSILCFIISLLAKAQAVTLPLVLVLIDYYYERRFTLGTVLEKVPFFLLSLGIGLLAIAAQQADNAVNVFHLSRVTSFFFGQYSLGVYLFKLIIPINQRALYEYPLNPDGSAPFYIYLFPLLLLAIAFVIWKTWNKNRFIPFGLLFFLFTILPVLQFFPVGEAIVAERYSYIPFIGLFIIIALGFDRLLQKSKGTLKNILLYGGAGVIILFILFSWGRIQVWKDSVALWTDVMEKDPKSVTAYINRGFIYNQDDFKLYNKAIQDCNDGMKIDSNNHKLYINRATSYRHLGLNDLAVADFTTALKKDSTDYQPYIDRGVIYTDLLNKFDLGIADFKSYLRHRSDNKTVLYNLGVAYYKKANYDSSMAYINKALQIAPDYAEAYYLCALLYALKNDFKNAYAYGSQAQSHGFATDPELLKGWQQRANIISPQLPKQ